MHLPLPVICAVIILVGGGFAKGVFAEAPAVPEAQFPPVPVSLREARPGLDFYRALDLSRPGLERVASAVNAGNGRAAEAAFASYLREKAWNSRVLNAHPPASSSNRRTAAGEAAAATQITLLGHTHDYRSRIDWLGNPVPQFPDWPLLLNRHGHWVDLAEAFRETGNPRYLRAFSAQFNSWITGAPMPEPDVQARGKQIERDRGHRRPFAPAWRTIEVGVRLGETWPKVFAAFVRQPGWSDQELVRFVAAIAVQADFLMEFEGPQNWLYIEARGLLNAAALLPEFKRAADWRDIALGRVNRSLQEEVYPDGAHEELTFWYHETVRSAVAAVIDNATALGHPIPPALEERFRLLYEAVLKARQPDGRLPQINDGDSLPAAFILEDGARRFDRPDFVYAASRGRAGSAPNFLSVSLPYAGWAVMREGWGAAHGYAFFGAGPFGGHAHEDKLGFILHARGHPFVIDTGRSAYGDSAWRTFNVGPTAHSTVLFDGIGQSRRWWRDNRLMRTQGPAEGFAFVTTPEVDYAAGAFGEMGEEFFYHAERGFAFVEHRRVLLYLKPDHWLVIDRFSTREPHPETPSDRQGGNALRPRVATTLFQLADHPHELSVQSGTWTGRPDADTRFRVTWNDPSAARTRVAKGEESPELLGWRFANKAEGHKPIAIPTLVLERDLPEFPFVQATLFSAEVPDAPGVGLQVAEGREGHIITLQQSGTVLGRALLRPAMEGVIIEWSGQRHVFR